MILTFAEQLKSGIEEKNLEYETGRVCCVDEHYVIGFEMLGARSLFSIGQPVYDSENNLMGYLGIGLYDRLNQSFTEFPDLSVPCYYWEICKPTKYCIEGKRIFTYWHKENL